MDASFLYEPVDPSLNADMLLKKSSLPDLIDVACEAAISYSQAGCGVPLEGEPLSLLRRLTCQVRGKALDGAYLLPQENWGAELPGMVQVRSVQALSDSRVAVLEATALQECVRAAAENFRMQVLERCGDDSSVHTFPHMARGFLVDLQDNLIDYVEARGAFYFSTLEVAFGIQRWAALVNYDILPVAEYRSRLDRASALLHETVKANPPETHSSWKVFELPATALHLRDANSSAWLQSKRRPSALTILSAIWIDGSFVRDPNELALLILELLKTMELAEMREGSTLSLRIMRRDLAQWSSGPLTEWAKMWSPVFARLLAICLPGESDEFDFQVRRIADAVLHSDVSSGMDPNVTWQELVRSSLIDMDRQLLNLWLGAVATNRSSPQGDSNEVKEATAAAVAPLLEASGASLLMPFAGFGAAATGAVLMARAVPSSALALRATDSSLVDTLRPALKTTALTQQRLNILTWFVEWHRDIDPNAPVGITFKSEEFAAIREELATHPAYGPMPRELQWAFVGGQSSAQLRTLAEGIGHPQSYSGPLIYGLNDYDTGALIVTTVAEMTKPEDSIEIQPTPILAALRNGRYELWGELAQPVNSPYMRLVQLLDCSWPVPREGVHPSDIPYRPFSWNVRLVSEGQLDRVEPFEADIAQLDVQSRFVGLLYGAIETAVMLDRDDLVSLVFDLIKGRTEIQEALANEELRPSGLNSPEITRWFQEPVPISLPQSSDDIFEMYPWISR